MGKNREGKEGGGVGFLIRNDIKNIIEEETNTQSVNLIESKWIKLKNKSNIAIGVVYGKQETAKKEIAERQFEELTTKTNMLQKTKNVIILGDFNAKIEIKKQNYTQKESRNGTLLQEFTKQTNTKIINSMDNHQGSWTRENRKNSNEKSIIDYIIISQPLEGSIIESATDNSNIYQIEGMNPTDHNVITATINTELKSNKKTIKRWKTGKKEDWAKFNEEIQKGWCKLNEKQRNYTNLQAEITKCMEKTIGSRTIKTNNKTKISNPRIKQAKKERKDQKQLFQKACKEDYNDKEEKMKKYINSQKTVKTLIEEQLKANTLTKVNRIIKEGGANSNTFWKIRKQLLNHNKNNEYETKNEDGEQIANPQQAKEHIAKYYEDLYQAREGEDSHKQWTEQINKTVNDISKQQDSPNSSKPFSYDELLNCIKRLKKNKSTGPDDIPNEVFIEADENTKRIYLQIMNQIYETEIIPPMWQEGEIIRIYKGKGEKGKCSNERGITLASNMGKVFERLLNNRITNDITMTEAQAGGQAGRSTADHIIILNSIINQKKVTMKKQDLYIVFLDVTKAYDKAWLNAILYATNKNGLKGKHWRLVKELNSNLTAKIRTQHGLTREINIRDSIRQGGVLSVIEYANLIDEIAKELDLRSIGHQKLWNNNTIGCLLWMDDVALIHHDKEEIQKMLNTTDDIAKRYHIKFGKNKSQVLTIGNSEIIPNLTLGDMQLDHTETYKYLGMTLNKKGNLESHLKATKGKIEAALQTIFSLAGNEEFQSIEMAAIWKLVNTCLIPILTYGAETWIPTKVEVKQAQRILENAIKRIIRAPITTPSEIITAETGIWDIETQIAKKQILYYHKIRTTVNPNSLIAITITDPQNPWRKHLEKTLHDTNIPIEEVLEKNQTQAKQYISNKLKEHQINKIYKAAEEKSKVRDYVCNKTRKTITERPAYMTRLQRKACTNIFNTRARMIKVKGNYKNNHTDMKCRWCKKKEETQIHILTECNGFKDLTSNTEQEIYYQDDHDSTIKSAEIMGKIIGRIEATQLM